MNFDLKFDFLTIKYNIAIKEFMNKLFVDSLNRN
jgi:hypothetical protein